MPAPESTPSVPSSTPSVDGLTSPAPTSTPQPAPEDPKLRSSIRHGKTVIITWTSVIYAAYALWCFTLMAVLPSPTGDYQSLVGIGLLTALLGAVAFIAVGLLLLRHIAKKDVPIAVRQRSLIKTVAVIVPGILLSIILPFMILRQPGLTIDTDPANAADFVAPLSITLSVQNAVTTLQKLGFAPVKYVWDTNGDGKAEDTTVVPQTTAVYNHAGIYGASVQITLSNGTVKTAARSIIISQEVFSVTPLPPIVEKPVRFSVAGLLTDPKLLSQVQWDFTGDGTADETTKDPEILHTFYAVGPVRVTAVMLLTNNTQRTYQRIVNVSKPPPLPFAATVGTDPQTLVGPAPFGVLFTLTTKEPLQEVDWDFGDGGQEHGADLVRIGHSFATPGIYSVLTNARSASGALAQITTLVRVTQKLSLPDLQFDGSPAVDLSKGMITGDVPLTINLTPKTSVPLIQFSWEAPQDTEMQISGNTFQAVYRTPGTSTVTLVAQDAQGNSLRLPLQVVATSAATSPVINVKPESGTAPLLVTFDASDTFIPPDQTIAGFKWQFGDEQSGTVAQVGGSQVQHTYVKAGEYHVQLSVVMASGKEYTTQRTIVVRNPTLSACLTASRVTVTAGGGVQFDSSCSTGTPTSILWDVRSADQPNVVMAQSPDPQYVYVFAQAGTYTVKLTIQDASGSTDSKAVTITVTP